MPAVRRDAAGRCAASRGQVAGGGAASALLAFAAVTQVDSTSRTTPTPACASRADPGSSTASRPPRAGPSATSPSSSRPATELTDSTAAAYGGAGAGDARSPTTLGVLAGTLPAPGPASGSRSTTRRTSSASTTCSTGSRSCATPGAEAIEINDEVRVVAQTSFEDAERGVVVDGRRISAAVRDRRHRQPRHPGDDAGLHRRVQLRREGQRRRRVGEEAGRREGHHVTEPASPDFASSADGQ